MRDWKFFAWVWRAFWFGVVVGVACMLILTYGIRNTTTADLIWSLAGWTPMLPPDLIDWIVKRRVRSTFRF